jgi:NADPH:quinone reductase-like Zn-dependent oxidoreductase
MRTFWTYGEVALLPVHAVAKYPENLSPIEGASIWMQYMTAYGLIEFGKMQQGNYVLITAAASSVGLTVRGYTLFSIVRNSERFERAKRWAFDHVASGELKPVIARTFTLHQIVDAHSLHGVK